MISSIKGNMDLVHGRDQRHYRYEAHHQHHNYQQQLEQADERRETSDDRSQVKSAATTSCSNVCEVTERGDELKHGSHSPSSDDAIPSPHHSSSHLPASAVSRPLYIHRPFEDTPAPLQAKDMRRFVGVDDRGRDYGRLQAVVGERRDSWPAVRQYRHLSEDGDRGSWQRQQLVMTAEMCRDEVDSSGDSACCDDDDVSDTQVRQVNTKPSQIQQQERVDTTVYSDFTDDAMTPLYARSESHHNQVQHTRKPGSLRNAASVPI